MCSQIFLELDGEKKEGVEFLDTTLTIGKADQVTSTLLNPVTMFMTRCWKQEEVKVVEVELLPLFVQLFLVSCLRQLS